MKQTTLNFDPERATFVLKNLAFDQKHIANAAKFSFDFQARHWWTQAPEKARQLADANPQILVTDLARTYMNDPEALAAVIRDAQAARDAARAALPPVVGTPQQEEFWAAIENSTGHLVLSARAGTGKTFSIVEASRRLKGRVGFSAFNKSIATDLGTKIPGHARAFTLHALGMRALCNYTGKLGFKTDVDSDKVKNLVLDKVAPEDYVLTPKKKREPDATFVSSVRDLVGLCKNTLTDPSDIGELEDLCERHDIDLEPSTDELTKRINSGQDKAKPYNMTEAEWTAELDARYRARIWWMVAWVLKACREVEGLGTIDHDDQIWLPVVLGLPVQQFDVLLVDEAQDMNLCQQRLAFMACPVGRIVIVGDEKQAIYAFRGADARSMGRMHDLLAATPAGCRIYPLTLTRRCPKTVVAQAQKLVPDIQAMPEAVEGVVEHVRIETVAQLAQPGDMILCRTNAPLMRAAHELLRIGKRPLLKGRDLGKRLKTLVEKLVARNADERAQEEADAILEHNRRLLGQEPEVVPTPAQQKLAEVVRLGRKTAEYRVREIERLTEAGKGANKITRVEDDCDTIEVLLEGAASLDDFYERIRAIFEATEHADAIMLCSVHGAKGLEADTVYILNPHLMPHYRAVLPEDIEQELNIKYVAITRAKQRLVYAHNPDAASACEENAKKYYVRIQVKPPVVQPDAIPLALLRSHALSPGVSVRDHAMPQALPSAPPSAPPSALPGVTHKALPAVTQEAAPPAAARAEAPRQLTMLDMIENIAKGRSPHDFGGEVSGLAPAAPPAVEAADGVLEGVIVEDPRDDSSDHWPRHDLRPEDEGRDVFSVDDVALEIDPDDPEMGLDEAARARLVHDQAVLLARGNADSVQEVEHEMLRAMRERAAQHAPHAPAPCAPAPQMELEAESDPFQASWQDQVRELLRQAERLIPFDEGEVQDALDAMRQRLPR